MSLPDSRTRVPEAWENVAQSAAFILLTEKLTRLANPNARCHSVQPSPQSVQPIVRTKHPFTDRGDG
jgi:hypothetical protein